MLSLLATHTSTILFQPLLPRLLSRPSNWAAFSDPCYPSICSQHSSQSDTVKCQSWHAISWIKTIQSLSEQNPKSLQGLSMPSRGCSPSVLWPPSFLIHPSISHFTRVVTWTCKDTPTTGTGYLLFPFPKYDALPTKVLTSYIKMQPSILLTPPLTLFLSLLCILLNFTVHRLSPHY